MSEHVQFSDKLLTQLFPELMRPLRVGVYRLQRTKDAGGGSYSYWNGNYWEAYKAWSELHMCSGFFWSGLTMEIKHLPKNHILLSDDE